MLLLKRRSRRRKAGLGPVGGEKNERDRGEQRKSERKHEGAPCGWMVFLGKFAALAVSGAQLGINTTWNREEACRSREGLLEECFTSNGKLLQLFAIV